MGFTRADVCKTMALHATWEHITKHIEELEEDPKTLTGSEKGKVTRKITGYEDQIAQIRAELEELPARPIDPAEALEALMGECSRIREAFERARDLFLDRAALNPKDAVEWAAESMVRAQLHWELVAPAAAAEDYDEMVRRLRAADADNDGRLLDGGSPGGSSSSFANAIKLAEHTARQGARRWGPKWILRLADEIYSERVASWKLLQGEGEDGA